MNPPRSGDLNGAYDVTRAPSEINQSIAREAAAARAKARKVLAAEALERHGVPVNADPSNPSLDLKSAAVVWADLCDMLGLNDPAAEPDPEPAPEPEPPKAEEPPVRKTAPFDDRGWRQHAACRDEDPELFHPIGNTGPALLQIEQAKAVCRRCSVKDRCLAWALESAEFGVFGGMSEDERRAFKRQGGLPVLQVAA